MSTDNSRFAWSESTTGGETVTVFLDGEKRVVPAGATVAAALLEHDDAHFCQSAAQQEDRTPYCLMGVCFECLVEIDGIKDRQACLEKVYEGMRVVRQNKKAKEHHEE